MNAALCAIDRAAVHREAAAIDEHASLLSGHLTGMQHRRRFFAARHEKADLLAAHVAVGNMHLAACHDWRGRLCFHVAAIFELQRRARVNDKRTEKRRIVQRQSAAVHMYARMDDAAFFPVFRLRRVRQHLCVRHDRLAAAQIQAVRTGKVRLERTAVDVQLAAAQHRRVVELAVSHVHRAAGLRQPHFLVAIDHAVRDVHLAARDVHHAVEIRVLLNFRLAAADAEETRNICLVDIIVPLQLAVCHDDALQRRAL